MERLSARYCTITAQGPHLGPAAVLEGRAKTSGYLDVVGKLADRAQLEPGNQVLEVGCGTGAITRWAHRVPTELFLYRCRRERVSTGGSRSAGDSEQHR